MKQLNNETQKETPKTTFKIALTQVRNLKTGLNIPLFLFALLTIFSLCLAFFIPDSLFLTVPFIVVPSYFAFLAGNSVEGIQNAQGIGFFLMFRNYFHKMFYGGFKVIKGFLKAFLVYFIGTCIGTIVLDYVLFANDASYNEIIDKIVAGESLENGIEEFQTLFYSNPVFAKSMYFISVFALLMATIAFLNHIGRNSPKFNFVFLNPKPMPLKQFNVIDKEMKRKNRKAFFKEYCGATWFIHPLILVSFVSGTCIDYFLLKNMNVGETFVISLFISFIILLFFFNYLVQVYHAIYLKFSHQYEETFIDLTMQLLTKYKDKIGVDEAQAEEIKKILDEQKKAFDNKNIKDNPEHKEENNKEDNQK